MPDSLPAMTVRQVAEYLNVNQKTVYRLAQRGELPGFKVAGAWRFQRNDLDAWIGGGARSTARTNRGKIAVPSPASRLTNSRTPIPTVLIKYYTYL